MRLAESREVAQLRRKEFLMLCSLVTELRLQLAGAPLVLERYDLLLIDAVAGPLTAAPATDFAAYGIELQRR
jgi:hypothetical protein